MFKFHIRKLVSLGYISKRHDGLYALTPAGKEYTNRLDETTGRTIAQPKASMLLFVRSYRDGQEYVLAHCRRREPFRDFWGIASAPVLRGVPIREAAARECCKQTGLDAMFEVRGQHRVIDVTPDGDVLEDKIFIILTTEVDGCPPLHKWYGGESEWLTRAELLAKQKLFPTTGKIFEMFDGGVSFAEDTCVYDLSEY